MGLKNLMQSMKAEGYIIPNLETYLLKLNEENDRKLDTNSPSGASKCPREICYKRLGHQEDYGAVDPRLRRIFDNGHGVHERLQNYMLNEGMLLMDEVPIIIPELQIQGHTDGILKLNRFEVGVLEIKSMNSFQFSKLIDAREDHKEQALVYMMGLEGRRRFLRKKCTDEKELEEYFKSKEYEDFILKYNGHIKDGSKYTREEKLQHRRDIHETADRILFNVIRPINKSVFLYENKDSQELKEFTVEYNEEVWNELKEKFEEINEYVAKGELPPRPKGVTKGGNPCRWCNYKNSCYVL